MIRSLGLGALWLAACSSPDLPEFDPCALPGAQCCDGKLPSDGGHPDPDLQLVAPQADSRAHQAWGIRVSSAIEGRVVATIDDGQGHRRRLEPPHSGTDFIAPLVGFRADRSYTIEAQLVTLDGCESIGEVQVFDVTVPALASGLPDLELTVDDGRWRQDTLFQAQGLPHYWLIRVDRDGQIVWYMDLSDRSLDVSVDATGDLVFEEGGVVVHTDWLGRDERVWTPSGEHIAYHHEVFPMPDGGLFTLAEQHVVVDDLPLGYDEACDPGQPALILDTAVVELDATGSVVRDFSVVERLDDHRIGFGGLALDEGAFDWAHGNAVVHVPAEDSLIVSVRSQDTVFSMSRTTGEVSWILAPPDGWAPEFEPLLLTADIGFQWPYHAHAPEPDGNRLLLFDNGNNQQTPCGEPSGFAETNRVVELEIDPAARTVREVWSWSPGLFSWAMGDADRLPDGTVLTTFGTLFSDELGNFAARGLGDSGGRIAEVDPATNEVTWELRIHSERSELAGGWKTPRAERLFRPAW